MGKNFRYCIHCKKLVKKDDKYCPACKKSLKIDEDTEKIKCSYCRITISKKQKYCQYCGTIVNQDTDDFDVSTKCQLPSFMSLGGNIFESGTRVFFKIVDDKIILKTLLKGVVEFDINDFTYCRSLSVFDFNKTKEAYISSSLYDIITLKFNDKTIHFKRDEDGENIIKLLYELIQYQVYEKHDMFLNTENIGFYAEI